MPMAPVRTWLAQQYGQATAQFHSRILSAWNSAGNLLFPPACVICGAEFGRADAGGAALCGGCHSRVLPPRGPACQRCASLLPAFWPADAGCPRCQNRRYYFAQSAALGSYRGTLQQVVLRMKRAAFEPLTCAMGRYLADLVDLRYGGAGIDLVVPIPMHWWRRLRRGTFPAQLLATVVGQHVSLPVARGLLRCRRRAKKQGTLRPPERFRNVRGAFGVSAGYDISGATLLIVDDIMTTGATASEAARVLRRAGAAAVYVAVVARGGG